METALLEQRPEIELPNWQIVPRWQDLAQIHDRETNLVVWNRRPFDVRDALNEIKAKHFNSFQLVLERSDDPTIVAAGLDDALELQSESAFYFYSDLIELTKNFFEISRAHEVGFRIETVSTDACTHFHVDLVTLRLVCTYDGPGTEWLKNSDVMREGLNQQNNSLVQKFGSKLQNLQPFQVGIMKGEKYSMNENKGLVHRSPPVAGTGLSRLFLRMDALS